ncbi:hypothetical protein [Streptomyces sp. 4R-3d]|uniref:hypothetical protein n=1 Tax=Streptomyces sp. 4R-3d TaxID=2559605 RepID=UPI001072BDCA|nr:hypothetical protein [Streptomyces sp. 4R-3d]TFI21343.1 hypothetical protein E4P36_33755 [Streptomyces sp. 4R-3d]
MLSDAPPPPTPVERLLLLADHYTQHNDTVDLLLSSSAPSSFDAHAASARQLATETRDVIKTVEDQRLYESPELADAVVRLKQLAYLSTEAAGQALPLGRELTALAPEAAVDSAERIAAEIRRRRWNTPAPPDDHLTPLQRAALREIARGHVVATNSLGRQYIHYRDARVLISTVRSLEAKNLVHRKEKSAPPAFHGGPPQDRIHLTPAGTTAFASFIALPSAGAAAPVPAARAVPVPPTTARNR